MKSRMYQLIIIFIVSLGFFSSIFLDEICAEDEYYEISLVSKDYEIVSISEIKGDTWVYFNITFVFLNSGNAVEAGDKLTLKVFPFEGNL